MSDAKWERYAAMGGIAFVVLNVIGTIVAGSPPATDDSAAEIAEYFAEHAGGIKASLWLGGIGSVGLVWWFGSLWRRMHRAEGGVPRLAVVSLIGLGLGGALFMASGCVNAATALRTSDVGEGARFFYTLSIVLLSAAGFGVGIHLLATNALVFRSRMLPIWMGWLGGIAGLAFLVAAVIGSASDSPAAMVVGIISFIGWCVWIVGVSVVMWRDTPTASAPSVVDGPL